MKLLERKGDVRIVAKNQAITLEGKKCAFAYVHEKCVRERLRMAAMMVGHKKRKRTAFRQWVNEPKSGRQSEKKSLCGVGVCICLCVGDGKDKNMSKYTKGCEKTEHLRRGLAQDGGPICA